ncbi:MAG: serine/threonine protein kinase [Planctomycetes bacterium]|nr:serine/threonine protein kinase [Planctomycetota bacterium]
MTGLEANTKSSTIGNYDLLQMIAEGGMAAVYKARQRETGALVAIKVMPPHLAKNPVLMKRFEQEYNAARAIDHVNIVRAIEFGHEDDRPFLVMEFVDGESLGQRLERDGKLSEQEAIHIIGQIALGLHRAHKKGLVHRDVKPDNILLATDGRAKLTDLGLVKELDAGANLTRAGRGLGTPNFMAPEQFRDAKNADARCDIYSLAATMYQMVTGTLPFQATGPVDVWMKKVHNQLESPRQLVPEISERVELAILRAMSPDRQQRPTSCRAFVEDLTGYSTRRLTPATESPTLDCWYLSYTAVDDVIHTARGSLKGIRRSIVEGRLSELSTLRISRDKAGPFLPLRDFQEFRDLVSQTSEPAQARSTSISATTPPPKAHSTVSPVPAALVTSSATATSSNSSSWVIPIPTPENGSKAPAAPTGPLIPLRNVRRPIEWSKWVALVLVAVSAAVAGYYLLPLLRYLPFF